MNSAPTGQPVYSLILPIFNEEAVIPFLLRRLDRLLDQLDGPAEVIFVDDGSRDTSGIVLADRATNDARYRYLALSRNFGHQIAISAGIEASSGLAVIVMDADLQDPPEVVLELIAKWKEGYDVVHAQRLSREGDGRFKRWSAALFYRTLKALTSVDIPSDVGDFRLIDRKAVDAFRAMPERDRFVRGMFGWIGFRQATVSFARLPRAAGETKYPLLKMMRLASDGIVGFSDAPLRLALWIGALVSATAIAYGAYVILLALSDANLVSGWASTIVVVAFLSGINLLMTGIVGLYVGRVHSEVKARPLYIVARAVGFTRVESSRNSASKDSAAPAARAKATFAH